MATILCVDDELDILDVMRFDLELAGHNVVTASSVDEALAKIQATNFDLVLSDVKMPVRDGKDLARTLRESGYKVPITFISGYAEVNEEFLLKFKIHGIISKPYQTSHLIGWLDKILRP